MDNGFKIKYLKYKNKYLNLKKLNGGANIIQASQNLEYFLNFNLLSNNIHNKYENFKNKNLILSPIKRAGGVSANGFTNIIQFKNIMDNDTFDTILKTSRRLNADNNYYEFFVGNCINKIKQFYPNFVHTFGYLNLETDLKTDLENTTSYSDISNFNNKSTFIDGDSNKLYNFQNISNGCQNNDRASVLIENVPNNLSTDKLFLDEDFLSDLNYNFFCILFQVYVTLSGLRNIYTHYDLHTGNVMYVKLPKKIEILYDLGFLGEKVKIYTQFVPVLIDYGRSSIDCGNLQQNILSSAFTELACQNKTCNGKLHPNCQLYNVGLAVERDANNIYSPQNGFFYIDIRKTNASADLRYVFDLLYRYHNSTVVNGVYMQIITDLFKILNPDNNPEWFTDNKINFNTNEKVDSLLTSGQIKTTTDMFIWLLKYYKNNFNKINFSDVYGYMSIFYDIQQNKKWSFTKV
jgi:hypothetical protein